MLRGNAGLLSASGMGEKASIHRSINLTTPVWQKPWISISGLIL